MTSMRREFIVRGSLLLSKAELVDDRQIAERPRNRTSTPSRSPDARQSDVRVIMLLGRRDVPTDGVRDYSNCLSQALAGRGIACEPVEVSWHEQGWLAALMRFWEESRLWRGRWVVLHYTALMWSRRGFPFVLPFVIKLLKLRGCRTAVVFHDGPPAPGRRWIDRIRGPLVEVVMRRLSRRASPAIVTFSRGGTLWLQDSTPSIEFIPVGSNIPSFDELAADGFVLTRHEIPAVGVFGIPDWPEAQKREIHAIVTAVKRASAHIGEVKLVVLGRGAKDAEPLLRKGLSGSSVRLQIDGLRGAREVSAALANCDAFLFVRGGISSRRGSAIAAIACGLPIVAYEGLETGPPLSHAGIVFVPQDNADSLGNELARVLLDPGLRSRLRERNLAVFRQWFSWDRIAGRWVEALNEVGVSAK